MSNTAIWQEFLNGNNVGGLTTDLRALKGTLEQAARNACPQPPLELELMITDVLGRLEWAQSGIDRLAKAMITRLNNGG